MKVKFYRKVKLLNVDVCISGCPDEAKVSPSGGHFTEGDVLTCASNGYPEASYTWTDSNGDIVSTAYTATLSEGWFNLTCTASGHLPTPCRASFTVTGYAVGKILRDIADH